MRTIAAACLLAALPLSAAEVKLNGFTFTLPDGFTIEFAAGPPLVERPISAAFDDEGRLYLTCVSGTGDPVEKQLIDRPHQVIRLEDTDGDGRYDKRTVFADKLSFPEGAMWHDGSLYVGAPPQIWKFTDTDGDGVAEQRSVWFDGKTIGHCANDIHGPVLGRDGRFYWTKGAFNEQHYALPNGRPFTTRASHLFRARPDGSDLEPVITGGMDNPVDVTFTTSGECILANTFFITPGGGQRDGLIHAIYGGMYGKENAVLDGHIATGGLMPLLLHMGAAAPSAVTLYDTHIFGPEYRGNLFAAYFNLRKISRHPFTTRGATLAAEDRDFVVADSGDFHPTDVEVDADGSLLIVDTGGWYKLCCPTSQLAKPDILGAVYRVRKVGAPPIEDPRGRRLRWDTATTAGLVSRFADARLAMREHAVQVLAKRGPEVLEGLAAAQGTDARLGAVWTATRIADPQARAFVRTALKDPDDSVRQAALHSVALWRDREAVPQLLTMLDHRVALEALGRIGDASTVRALLAATAPTLGDVSDSGAPAEDSERVREHALIYALIEIGDATAITQGLFAAQSSTQRAALVALDQLKSPALTPEKILPLLISTNVSLKRTAAWIVSHRPEWGAELASHFQSQLTGPGQPSKELPALVARLAKSVEIQQMLSATLRDGPSLTAKTAALAAISSAGLKDIPTDWLDALASMIESIDQDTLEVAVHTVSRLAMPKGGHPGLATALAAVGRRDDLPARLRLNALAASATPGSLEPPLFALVLAALPPAQPLTMRSAAAEILARAPLDPDQRLQLADTIRATGPLETPRLLAAFNGQNDEALGLRLVSSLQASPGLPGVRGPALQAVLAKYPASVRDAGNKLLAAMNASAAQILARVSKLAAALPPGDVRRGQALFNSTRATCTACHAIGYAGGRFGPDLTRIGQARSARDLLEAIVAPSASFVQGYEPFTVTTRDGAQHFGLLRKNSPDEILLATGPQSEERLARADVTDMQPGTISLMPQGFDQLLSPQDLADLIAFLDPKK